MEPPRNNIHRRIARANQRAAGSKLATNTARPPRIEFPICIYDASGGFGVFGEVPPFGDVVDGVDGQGGVVGWGGAEGEGWGGGEVEGALALPVLRGDEAGDDGGDGGGGAVLPVGEGFVAEEPKPLAVVGVGDCEVGVHWVGGVVGVEAADVEGIVVAVTLAVCVCGI